MDADAEFTRVIAVVLIVGLGIAAVGATLLFIAFRALSGEKPASGRHLAFVVATLLFVLLSCIGLFILSYR